MEYPGFDWPPRVGDRVHVKGTGLRGPVTRIEGSGAAQRFILILEPHAAAVEQAAARYGMDAAAARTSYELDELEPGQ